MTTREFGKSEAARWAKTCGIARSIAPWQIKVGAETFGSIAGTAARISAGSPNRNTDIIRHAPRIPANGARKSSIAPRVSDRRFSTAIRIANFQNTRLTSGANISPSTGTRSNRNIGNGFNSGNTAGESNTR